MSIWKRAAAILLTVAPLAACAGDTRDAGLAGGGHWSAIQVLVRLGGGLVEADQGSDPKTNWLKKGYEDKASQARLRGAAEEEVEWLEKGYADAQQTFGERDVLTLSMLQQLATAKLGQGRHADAEALVKKGLETAENTPYVSSVVWKIKFTLSEIYKSQGRWDEAADVLGSISEFRVSAAELKAARRRSLDPQLSQRFPGLESQQEMRQLEIEVEVAIGLGRAAEAEALVEKARQICERHSADPSLLYSLAEMYSLQGRYEDTERNLLRAQEIAKENEQKLASAEILRRIPGYEIGSTIVRALGGEANTECIYKFSEAGCEQYNPSHGRFADLELTVTPALARLYWRQGRYAEAEAQYTKMLKASEEHSDFARAQEPLYDLAALAEIQGRYDEAESLQKRALQQTTKAHGERDSTTLLSMMKLAVLYHRQKRYEEAEALYQKALRLGDEALGDRHLTVMSVRFAYAILLAARGRDAAATAELARIKPGLDYRHRGALKTEELFKSQPLLPRSQSELSVSQSGVLSVLLTMAVQHPSPESRDFLADLLLQWKQTEGEEQARLARLVQRSHDPRVKALGQEISRLEGRMSFERMSFSNPFLQSPFDRAGESDEKKSQSPEFLRLMVLSKNEANEYYATYATKDEKENELRLLSREYQDQPRLKGVDLAALRAALPPSGALIEFRQYWPIDLTAARFGEPRWGALLVTRDGQPMVADVGSVAETESLWRTLVEAPDPGVADVAASKLYAGLFGPFESTIRDLPNLYVAPEGLLYLIPWDRLMLPGGRYWMERQTVRVIQTGRDLLDVGQPTTAQRFVGLGGINFDASPEGTEVVAVSSGSSVPSRDGTSYAASARTRDAIGRFRALPETYDEAQEIASLYRSMRGEPVEVWTGLEAQESRLKKMSIPPRVLHLATHGFFLGSIGGAISGVTLSGANRGLAGALGADDEDGVLYDSEAATLNLDGTELVVVSACETAKGNVTYTEGLGGLAQALRIAGAGSVLVTLSPVDDVQAHEFMLAFYRNWLKQAASDPSAALRQTKLDYIQHARSALRKAGVWSPYVLIGR